MRRVRNIRVRHLIISGFVIGLIIASGITINSARRYTEPAVYLLGSGAGLSALIVSESSRVFVVNGDDPAALANAFAGVRPAMLRRIDLLVLAPGATERVAERAVEIANPRRLYALPNNRFHPGNAILGLTIRPMDGPSEIQLTDDLEMRLDPNGFSGWTIEVNFSDIVMQLSERVPLRSPASLIAVMGATVGDSVAAIDSPIIGASAASPETSGPGRGVSFLSVDSAESVRIRVVDRTLSIEP
jgi:hypothetical protein